MEAIGDDAAKAEGHETRVHTEHVAEGLHERLDQLQKSVESKAAKACEQLKLQLELEKTQLEKSKAKVAAIKAKAEAKDRENQAFVKRVEAGDCTPHEQDILQHKRLTERIRAHKAKLALEKLERKLTKRAAASTKPTGPPASKHRLGASSEEGGAPEVAKAEVTHKQNFEVGENAEPPAARAAAARWQLPEDFELVHDGPEGEASAAALGSGASAERSDTEPEDAAPCSAATSTAEPAPKRPRRNAPKAKAAPKREARECEIGEIVKLNSKSGGKEFDGIVKSKAEGGCYWVFVEGSGKEIRMRLPQRAASSN